MGLKIELDYEAADLLVSSILKELHTSLQENIEESAKKLSKGDHHRVDLADHYRILFAAEELYRYYTGGKL